MSPTSYQTAPPRVISSRSIILTIDRGDVKPAHYAMRGDSLAEYDQARDKSWSPKAVDAIKNETGAAGGWPRGAG